MKQTAIENVRVIAKLENANQSLEAKVKKLSEAKNEHFEELQNVLMSKDDKIEQMIDEIGLQDDLREDLEQVQQQLDTLKEQVFDAQAQKQIKQLEEKYESSYEWFTQNLQELEQQLKSTHVDLHQRTMLLKEKDRKNENRGASGMFPINGSDDEENSSVGREN